MSDTSEPTAQHTLRAEVVATTAVAVFSVTTAAGFARVFPGWSFLVDMAVIAVGGHLGCLALRRLGVPGWAAIPAAAVGLGWLIAVVYYPSTTWFGVPTTATWDLFRVELDAVREQFPVAVAPVDYGGGWDVMAAIGLAFIVLLADIFAFRAFARAETLVPGGVLFVFIGALGTDRSRVPLTVALVAAGVVTTVVLRAYHSRTGHRGGTIATLRRVGPAAVAATIVIALAAGTLGPRLPGASAAPLLDTRGGGHQLTNVMSPLVDIRSRLTNRSDEEMFRVRAEKESYWRSTALAQFDGSTWSLPAQQLHEEVLSEPLSGTGMVRNRQRIFITGLGGSLVPAAAVPYAASGPARLRWLSASETLLVVGGDLANGDVIEVMSATPDVDAGVLRRARADARLDPIYTSLPADLPAIVVDEAFRVAGAAAGPYDAAMLLQDWFHRDFEYSLEVQPGHGNSAIAAFLDARVGYCEQFAGTFAAMMRVLGHPARVAVGFTSGTRMADGSYSVRGRNAHAWPEVWFDGVGWVAFEPTPGRGAPNAESYTGLPPMQDATPLPDGADDVAGAPTTTIANASAGPGSVELPEDPIPRQITPQPEVPSPPRDLRVPIVLVLLAATAALPAVVRQLRRRARRGAPEIQLARLWGDALAALRRGGVEFRASDTPFEAVEAATRTLPLVARPFGDLAEVVTAVTYGPPGVVSFDRCRGWTRQIERIVDADATATQRFVRYFTVWR